MMAPITTTIPTPAPIPALAAVERPPPLSLVLASLLAELVADAAAAVPVAEED